MSVAGLTSDGDWRFGSGKAAYLHRSDAIKQNVVTRLKSFTEDWYLDISAGLPWFELMGERNQEERALREVERVVLATEGVMSIELLRIATDRKARTSTIEITIVDIFNERFTESITP